MKIIDDPQELQRIMVVRNRMVASQLVLFTAVDYKLIAGTCFPGSFHAESGIYRVEERRTFPPALCQVRTGPGYHYPIHGLVGLENDNRERFSRLC